MRRHDLAILVLGTALLGGWTAGASEVPVPVPQPGPGPTVPPKPSDPMPLPPTRPPSIPRDGGLQSFVLHLIADRNGRASETVSGLLVAMNLEQRTGRLTTDLGTTVSFIIPNPDLFRNLSIGERLTLKLDSAQRAIGVLEEVGPELPAPGPRNHLPSH